MQDEEWRPIPEFPDYLASSLGRVRSTRGPRPRVLSVTTDRYGYLRVSLWSGERPKSRRVHSWVAAAFYGPRPRGLVIRHLDGNRLNNRVDNLCYGTPRENVQDSIRHGTFRPNPDLGKLRLGVRKTHCPQGHEYTPENSYIDPRAKKSCRTCRRAVNREYWRQRRAS